MMATIALKIDPSGAKSGARVVRRVLDDVKGKARETVRAVDQIGNHAKASMAKAQVAAGGMAASFAKAKLGIVAVGAAMTAGLASGIRSARSLDAALAETSTLIGGSAEEMAALRDEAQRMASTFGGTSTQQVNAFYQAISAGAGSVADATALLETANRLAIGGVTNITTSVDVLTTAVNAYAGTGLTAAQSSDILFAGVKAGKTTVDELAVTLGRVVPIAAQMGIGFDEVVGSVASLTKGGQSTALAVTGLRGVLSAVLKPTSEATKLAAELGLEFNSAAIEAKGLQGFLADVAEKTGGASDAYARLFGQVEGLGAVLALAANEGDALSATMAEMRASTGATDEAFGKIADSLNQRLAVQLSKLKEVFTDIGTIILSVVVPALEFITAAFGLASNAIQATVGWFASAANVIFQFRESAEQLPKPIEESRIAMNLLNEALGGFTGLSSSAKAKAIESANAHRKDAVAALESAQAELVLLEAKQAVVEAALEQNTLTPDLKGFYGNLVGADVDAQKAVVESLQLTVAEMLNAVKSAVSGVGDVADETVSSVETVVSVVGNAAVAAREIEPVLAEIQESATDVANTMVEGIAGGLKSMVFQAKTAKEAFTDMANSILDQLYDILIQQKLVAALTSAIGGIGGGSFFGIGTTSTGSLDLSMNAKGNAFSGGNVIPFARGGITSGPTAFPMANGNVGLMGEAGREAIMPLERTSGGKLGVRASGAGGVVQNISITAMSDGDIDRVLAKRMPQLKNMTLAAIRDERTRGAI